MAVEDCDHIEPKWTCVKYQDWNTGEWVEDWVNDSRYSVRDIDLHRYQCYKCGKIMYYSGRAREHFEEGTIFPSIRGLDKKRDQ